MDEDTAAGGVAPAETIPAAAEHPDLAAALNAWRERWYPDPAPGNHPAPPFSGAWHHARDAVASLFEDILTLFRRPNP